VNLSIVIHNHQPVDNADDVIESVYSRAYLPFVRTLSEFPDVKANLHYTGYLLEWIESKHPELIDLLRRMVRSGQVEVIGGGYYEPIMPTIPDRDAIGQVRLESEKISGMFGHAPSGVWTAERAWEPQSPELLRSCGIEYTLLDDTTFGRSGIPPSGSCHPYLVESRGSVVTVFPMSKTLRYRIPWKGPSATISYLRGLADDTGDRIAVFGDDGEKFGAWPTTQELVYGNGWLQEFLEYLLKNKEWLHLVTLSKYLSKNPAHRRTYLPAASYDEMMEWSMPAESGRGGRSGFWRLFLAKYPESGRLYSKMLSVSDMVEALEGDKKAIQRELWKGQCNDAYWHGVFGGIYSPLLRRITYHHLLTAQRMVEARVYGRGPWLHTGSQVLNGRSEHSIDTNDLSVRVCPEAGGSLAELGFKRAGVNLLDVVARRRERYHETIRRSVGRHASKRVRSIHDPVVVKDAGLRELLAYDRYPRYSFMDHLVSPDTGVQQLSSQKFRELVPLAGMAYPAKVTKTQRSVEVELSLALGRPNPSKLSTLQKLLSVDAAGATLSFRYRVSFAENPPASRLLVQINLGSLGDAAFTKSFSRAKSLSNASTAVFEYPSLGMSATLEFSRGLDVWMVPVLTVSQSESGFESLLQGVSVVPNLEMADRDNEFEMKLSVQ
jgi:4-alpha-glucanotransferase